MEKLAEFFGVASLISIFILFIWFIFICFFRNFVYVVHSKMFDISKERLGEIHYILMGAYKLAIYIVFIIPYIVLKLIE